MKIQIREKIHTVFGSERNKMFNFLKNKIDNTLQTPRFFLIAETESDVQSNISGKGIIYLI
jgi:hypothetical protein